MGSDDFIMRNMMGGVAGKGNAAKKKIAPIIPIKRESAFHGKRVVYVTPHAVAAKEEAEKYTKRGLKTEIKKEKDDTGKLMFVVYIYE